MMYGTKRALTQKAGATGGVPAVTYSLYDAFTTDRAAGAVNGTVSESPFPTGGGANRAVSDSGNKLSISGSQLLINGAVDQNTSRLYYPIQTRVAGKILIAELVQSPYRVTIGWDTGTTFYPYDYFYFYETNNFTTYIADGTSSPQIPGGYSNGVTYRVALVQRATGMWFFLKGGAYTNWTLIQVSAIGGANLYPTFTGGSPGATGGLTKIIVPDAAFHLYIPNPLVYDTFTRANGALGSTETVGPDSQFLAALTWLFTTGVWAVSGNVAKATQNLGTEKISNGDFASDTVWTKGSGWTIAGGVGVATAVNGGLLTQTVSISTYFARMTYTISGRSGGGLTARFGGASNPMSSKTSDGTYTETSYPVGTTFGFAGDNPATLNVDDVSIKEIPNADLFAVADTGKSDVFLSVPVTTNATGVCTPSGAVLNLDSESNPQNFVVAFLHQAASVRLKLWKYIAGTPTEIGNFAFTYSAGARLEVNKINTGYRVYYNGAFLGAVTVSDVGIISNTKHGKFSADARPTFSEIQIWPSGSGGNEHAALDAF